MANSVNNDWEDDSADLLNLVDALLRRFSNLSVAGNSGPNTPERRGTNSGIGRRGTQANVPARSGAQGVREGAVPASSHEPQGEASAVAGITNNNGTVRQNVVINIFNTPSYSNQESLAVAPTSPQRQHVQRARENSPITRGHSAATFISPDVEGPQVTAPATAPATSGPATPLSQQPAHQPAHHRRENTPASLRWYVVWKGISPGVYQGWENAKFARGDHLIGDHGRACWQPSEDAAHETWRYYEAIGKVVVITPPPATD